MRSLTLLFLSLATVLLVGSVSAYNDEIDELVNLMSEIDEDFLVGVTAGATASGATAGTVYNQSPAPKLVQKSLICVTSSSICTISIDVQPVRFGDPDFYYKHPTSLDLYINGTLVDSKTDFSLFQTSSDGSAGNSFPFNLDPDMFFIFEAKWRHDDSTYDSELSSPLNVLTDCLETNTFTNVVVVKSKTERQIDITFELVDTCRNPRTLQFFCYVDETTGVYSVASDGTKKCTYTDDGTDTATRSFEIAYVDVKRPKDETTGYSVSDFFLKSPPKIVSAVAKDCADVPTSTCTSSGAGLTPEDVIVVTFDQDIIVNDASAPFTSTTTSLTTLSESQVDSLISFTSRTDGTSILDEKITGAVSGATLTLTFNSVSASSLSKSVAEINLVVGMDSLAIGGVDTAYVSTTSSVGGSFTPSSNLPLSPTGTAITVQERNSNNADGNLISSTQWGNALTSSSDAQTYRFKLTSSNSAASIEPEQTVRHNNAVCLTASDALAALKNGYYVKFPEDFNGMTTLTISVYVCTDGVAAEEADANLRVVLDLNVSPTASTTEITFRDMTVNDATSSKLDVSIVDQDGSTIATRMIIESDAITMFPSTYVKTSGNAWLAPYLTFDAVKNGLMNDEFKFETVFGDAKRNIKVTIGSKSYEFSVTVTCTAAGTFTSAQQTAEGLVLTSDKHFTLTGLTGDWPAGTTLDCSKFTNLSTPTSCKARLRDGKSQVVLDPVSFSQSTVTVKSGYFSSCPSVLPTSDVTVPITFATGLAFSFTASISGDSIINTVGCSNDKTTLVCSSSADGKYDVTYAWSSTGGSTSVSSQNSAALEITATGVNVDTTFTHTCTASYTQADGTVISVTVTKDVTETVSVDSVNFLLDDGASITVNPYYKGSSVSNVVRTCGSSVSYTWSTGTTVLTTELSKATLKWESAPISVNGQTVPVTLTVTQNSVSSVLNLNLVFPFDDTFLYKINDYETELTVIRSSTEVIKLSTTTDSNAFIYQFFCRTLDFEKCVKSDGTDLEYDINTSVNTLSTNLAAGEYIFDLRVGFTDGEVKTSSLKVILSAETGCSGLSKSSLTTSERTSEGVPATISIDSSVTESVTCTFMYGKYISDLTTYSKPNECNFVVPSAFEDDVVVRASVSSASCTAGVSLGAKNVKGAVLPSRGSGSLSYLTNSNGYAIQFSLSGWFNAKTYELEKKDDNGIFHVVGTSNSGLLELNYLNGGTYTLRAKIYSNDGFIYYSASNANNDNNIQCTTDECTVTLPQINLSDADTAAKVTSISDEINNSGSANEELYLALTETTQQCGSASCYTTLVTTSSSVLTETSIGAMTTSVVPAPLCVNVNVVATFTGNNDDLSEFSPLLQLAQTVVYAVNNCPVSGGRRLLATDSAFQLNSTKAAYTATRKLIASDVNRQGYQVGYQVELNNLYGQGLSSTTRSSLPSSGTKDISVGDSTVTVSATSTMGTHKNVFITAHKSSPYAFKQTYGNLISSGTDVDFVDDTGAFYTGTVQEASVKVNYGSVDTSTAGVPICVRWDETAEDWTTTGVQALEYQFSASSNYTVCQIRKSGLVSVAYLTSFDAPTLTSITASGGCVNNVLGGNGPHFCPVSKEFGETTLTFAGTNLQTVSVTIDVCDSAPLAGDNGVLTCILGSGNPGEIVDVKVTSFFGTSNAIKLGRAFAPVVETVRTQNNGGYANGVGMYGLPIGGGVRLEFRGTSFGTSGCTASDICTGPISHSGGFPTNTKIATCTLKAGTASAVVNAKLSCIGGMSNEFSLEYASGTCDDNILNGNEIQTDCGGDCAACSVSPVLTSITASNGCVSDGSMTLRWCPVDGSNTVLTFIGERFGGVGANAPQICATRPRHDATNPTTTATCTLRNGEAESCRRGSLSTIGGSTAIAEVCYARKPVLFSIEASGTGGCSTDPVSKGLRDCPSDGVGVTLLVTGSNFGVTGATIPGLCAGPAIHVGSFPANTRTLTCNLLSRTSGDATTVLARVHAIGGVSDAAFPVAFKAAETCTDGIKNQDEEGVDCGGVCTACVNPPIITSVSASGGCTTAFTLGTSTLGVDYCPIDPTLHPTTLTIVGSGFGTSGATVSVCQDNTYVQFNNQITCSLKAGEVASTVMTNVKIPGATSADFRVGYALAPVLSSVTSTMCGCEDDGNNGLKNCDPGAATNPCLITFTGAGFGIQGFSSGCCTGSLFNVVDTLVCELRARLSDAPADDNCAASITAIGGVSDSVNIGYAEIPRCDDLKQNGDEQGVDCGGSNCVACADPQPVINAMTASGGCVRLDSGNTLAFCPVDANAMNVMITFYGTGFGNGTDATVSACADTPVLTTVSTVPLEQTLSCKLLNGDAGSSSSVRILVPGGTSNAVTISYALAPVLASIEPATDGPGNTCTISGNTATNCPRGGGPSIVVRGTNFGWSGAKVPSICASDPVHLGDPNAANVADRPGRRLLCNLKPFSGNADQNTVEVTVDSIGGSSNSLVFGYAAVSTSMIDLIRDNMGRIGASLLVFMSLAFVQEALRSRAHAKDTIIV